MTTETLTVEACDLQAFDRILPGGMYVQSVRYSYEKGIITVNAGALYMHEGEPWWGTCTNRDLFPFEKVSISRELAAQP